MSIRPHVTPQASDRRGPASKMPGPASEKPGPASKRPEPVSEGPGPASEGPRGDVRTYGRTDSSCILKDFVPSNNMQCDSEPLEIRLLALGHLVLRSFFCSHHSLLLLLPFPWLNGTSCRYNNVLTLRNVGTLTIIKTVACLSQ